MEANDKKTSKKKLIIVFGIVAFVSGLSLEPFLLTFLLAFSRNTCTSYKVHYSNSERSSLNV
ncbi:hypothetical protein [Alkalicoccobacillus gibsonii]|uniref:hypothetical protein n=1 Tax=Alkalicoccobacillus gibsonii TaxID=79881 RepID=UPI0019344926|nr:hypothetical protein [Alkalicoccobacillus gibsonii]MBM0064822.1 hypothetical protein [Alkalicoccobacillus gibsonii]